MDKSTYGTFQPAFEEGLKTIGSIRDSITKLKGHTDAIGESVSNMAEKWEDPEPTDKPLIERFYSEPKLFNDWIGDALTDHDAETMELIRGYMCSINTVREEDRHFVEERFGKFMFNLINNYMLDASKKDAE